MCEDEDTSYDEHFASVFSPHLAGDYTAKHPREYTDLWPKKEIEDAPGRKGREEDREGRQTQDVVEVWGGESGGNRRIRQKVRKEKG